VARRLDQRLPLRATIETCRFPLAFRGFAAEGCAEARIAEGHPEL
jgi:hypothetical protein